VALVLKQAMGEVRRIFLKVVPVEADLMVVGSWAEK